ncbi:hypothetical protein J0S82_020279, partial [Galemys pyrenaicus]
MDSTAEMKQKLEISLFVLKTRIEDISLKTEVTEYTYTTVTGQVLQKSTSKMLTVLLRLQIKHRTQTKINETIIAVQAIITDPKIDYRPE